MSSGKSPAVTQLEQSLIQYLCQKPEVEERVNGGARRVRSLSISFDARNPQKPSFSVQIGMFEVTFNAITGMKEKGSCYGLERYIIDWYLRPGINNEMMYIIRSLSKEQK